MKRFKPIIGLLLGLAFAGAIIGSCAEEESSDDESAAPAGGDDPGSGPGQVQDDDDSATGGGEWWRRAVFLEVFVRSYYDSNGDGIGDLPGLTEKLPYLSDLGIGALWLMPIYPTRFEDSGYDVADYTDINPEYGTLDDFEALLAAAHARGIRIFLDGVFNHTSVAHAWFQESRQSRDNPKADWYLWADEPPFDCVDPLASATEGERWTFDEARGQYYYHHFREGMPDLNYFNPDVRRAVLDVMRFWLDLGVDGFRLDTAHLYYEDEDYCEHHPLTREFHRAMRALLDEYDDRALVGELVGPPALAASYFGDGTDGLHMVFNFFLDYAFFATDYLHAPELVNLVLNAENAAAPPGAQWANFTANHDFYRDYDLLLRDERRLKLSSTLQLTLPGTPFLYYGQEIGMGNGWQQPIDYRDSARTPMHWTGGRYAGFSTVTPWLALAPNYRTHNVAVERDDPRSLLSHYRRLLRLRNSSPALKAGEMATVATADPAVYGYFRTAGAETILVLFNFAGEPRSATVWLGGTPWEGGAGVVRDLYTEENPSPLVAGTAEYSVVLPAYGFALLRLEAD
ncbi:MAG: DUF3459 domain-containing protein [Myxococcales bacterium]|nr:DUF3459 domain-containing protein [Myxococcales bacterium]